MVNHGLNSVAPAGGCAGHLVDAPPRTCAIMTQIEMRESMHRLIELVPIPPNLFEEIKTRNCVLFSGAGVTTESKREGRSTFHEMIKRESAYPRRLGSPSFPDVMQYFCETMDGGQRSKLIRRIVSRIEDFAIPGEAHRSATRFYNQVAAIPFLTRFITTNWDPFLERSLNILVPIVEDNDLPFWDDSKRQVIKLHGCVTRPSTIVATRQDYRNCVRKRRLVFNKLKDQIATKTFLFVGYSMGDRHVRVLIEETTRRLGPFRRLAYAVDPSADEKSLKFWRENHIQVLKLTDIAFIEQLTSRFQSEGLIPSDQLMAFMGRELDRIVKVHISMRQTQEGGIASAIYQDGLLHSLEEVLNAPALGWTFDDYKKELGECETTLREMFSIQNIVEIAYFSGWCEVLRGFCAKALHPFRVYFHPRKHVPIVKYVKR